MPTTQTQSRKKQKPPPTPLEAIKPVMVNPRLVQKNGYVELSTGDSDRQTNFNLDAVTYLTYFAQGQNIQEIILHEMAAERRVNFIMLKDILSQLYWQDHLSNSSEYRDSIETADGSPAFEGVLTDPIGEMPIDRSINLFVFLIPVFLSALLIMLFFKTEQPSFFIIFFPQVFLTAKGLLSMAASYFLFDDREPMSLNFSLLGIYYRLTSGKRTPISQAHFYAHVSIIIALSVLSVWFFWLSTDPVMRQFGGLAIMLMLTAQASPLQNTDFSNFKAHLDLERIRREGLERGKVFNEKFQSVSLSLFYNFLSVSFFVGCSVRTIKYATAKNILFLVYQIIFDIAAAAVFLDFADQFENSKSLGTARNWSSKFRASLQKYRTEKDIRSLVTAIPIFEGVPAEAFSQMVRGAKVIKLKNGARVCKDGEMTTDLFVVIEGQVGIFKKQVDGKNQKLIDIYAGSIFGEGSFLLGNPRKGSAYCLSDTLLLIIKRPKAFAASDRTQEKNLSLFQKKIWSFQALAQSETFRDLPSEAVMQLVKSGDLQEVPPQTFVLKQGDPSDSLWVIIQGKCQAIVDGKKVRDMNSRDAFGEIGLLWNTPRTSSVQTTAPSILLKVHARDVWNLLAHNLNIAIILQRLGEHRLKTGGFAEQR